jgi:hypothetical protein
MVGDVGGDGGLYGHRGPGRQSDRTRISPSLLTMPCQML